MAQALVAMNATQYSRDSLPKCCSFVDDPFQAWNDDMKRAGEGSAVVINFQHDVVYSRGRNRPTIRLVVEQGALDYAVDILNNSGRDGSHLQTYIKRMLPEFDQYRFHHVGSWNDKSCLATTGKWFGFIFLPCFIGFPCFMNWIMGVPRRINYAACCVHASYLDKHNESDADLKAMGGRWSYKIAPTLFTVTPEMGTAVPKLIVGWAVYNFDPNNLPPKSTNSTPAQAQAASTSRAPGPESITKSPIHAVPSSNVTCGKCGSTIAGGSKFCGECGNRVENAGRQCSACNKQIDSAQQRFCDGCGMELAVL